MSRLRAPRASSVQKRTGHPSDSDSEQFPITATEIRGALPEQEGTPPLVICIAAKICSTMRAAAAERAADSSSSKQQHFPLVSFSPANDEQKQEECWLFDKALLMPVLFKVLRKLRQRDPWKEPLEWLVSIEFVKVLRNQPGHRTLLSVKCSNFPSNVIWDSNSAVQQHLCFLSSNDTTKMMTFDAFADMHQAAATVASASSSSSSSPPSHPTDSSSASSSQPPASSSASSSPTNNSEWAASFVEHSHFQQLPGGINVVSLNCQALTGDASKIQPLREFLIFFDIHIALLQEIGFGRNQLHEKLSDVFSVFDDEHVRLPGRDNPFGVGTAVLVRRATGLAAWCVRRRSESDTYTHKVAGGMQFTAVKVKVAAVGAGGGSVPDDDSSSKQQNSMTVVSVYLPHSESPKMKYHMPPNSSNVVVEEPQMDPEDECNSDEDDNTVGSDDAQQQGDDDDNSSSNNEYVSEFEAMQRKDFFQMMEELDVAVVGADFNAHFERFANNSRRRGRLSAPFKRARDMWKQLPTGVAVHGPKRPTAPDAFFVRNLTVAGASSSTTTISGGVAAVPLCKESGKDLSDHPAIVATLIFPPEMAALADAFNCSLPIPLPTHRQRLRNDFKTVEAEAHFKRFLRAWLQSKFYNELEAWDLSLDSLYAKLHTELRDAGHQSGSQCGNSSRRHRQQQKQQRRDIKNQSNLPDEKEEEPQQQQQQKNDQEQQQQQQKLSRRIARRPQQNTRISALELPNKVIVVPHSSSAADQVAAHLFGGDLDEMTEQRESERAARRDERARVKSRWPLRHVFNDLRTAETKQRVVSRRWTPKQQKEPAGDGPSTQQQEEQRAAKASVNKQKQRLSQQWKNLGGRESDFITIFDSKSLRQAVDQQQQQQLPFDGKDAVESFITKMVNHFFPHAQQQPASQDDEAAVDEAPSRREFCAEVCRLHRKTLQGLQSSDANRKFKLDGELQKKLQQHLESAYPRAELRLFVESLKEKEDKLGNPAWLVKCAYDLSPSFRRVLHIMYGRMRSPQQAQQQQQELLRGHQEQQQSLPTPPSPQQQQQQQLLLPQMMCNSVQVLKHKQGKTPEHHVDSHRAIGPDQNFNKLWMQQARRRFTAFGIDATLHRFVMGAVSGFSHVQAAAELVTHFSDAFRCAQLARGDNVFCAFFSKFDVKKAYPSLNRKEVVDALRRHGERAGCASDDEFVQLCSVVESWLGHSKCSLDFGGFRSMPVKTKRGVPAGSVLGDLCLAVVMSESFYEMDERSAAWWLEQVEKSAPDRLAEAESLLHALAAQAEKISPLASDQFLNAEGRVRARTEAATQVQADAGGAAAAASGQQQQQQPILNDGAAAATYRPRYLRLSLLDLLELACGPQFSPNTNMDRGLLRWLTAVCFADDVGFAISGRNVQELEPVAMALQFFFVFALGRHDLECTMSTHEISKTLSPTSVAVAQQEAGTRGFRYSTEPVRFLGVVIDRRMQWLPMLDAVEQNLRRQEAAALAKIRGCRFGWEAQVTVRGIIASCFHTAPAWWPTLRRRTPGGDWVFPGPLRQLRRIWLRIHRLLQGVMSQCCPDAAQLNAGGLDMDVVMFLDKMCFDFVEKARDLPARCPLWQRIFTLPVVGNLHNSRRETTLRHFDVLDANPRERGEPFDSGADGDCPSCRAARRAVPCHGMRCDDYLRKRLEMSRQGEMKEAREKQQQQQRKQRPRHPVCYHPVPTKIRQLQELHKSLVSNIEKIAEQQQQQWLTARKQAISTAIGGHITASIARLIPEGGSAILVIADGSKLRAPDAAVEAGAGGGAAAAFSLSVVSRSQWEVVALNSCALHTAHTAGTAEAVALHAGLGAALRHFDDTGRDSNNNSPRPTRFIFCGDCVSVYEPLAAPIPSAKSLRDPFFSDMRVCVDALREHLPVDFVMVPSHVGWGPHDAVDEAAGNAARGPSPVVAVAVAELPLAARKNHILFHLQSRIEHRRRELIGIINERRGTEIPQDYDPLIWRSGKNNRWLFYSKVRHRNRLLTLLHPLSGVSSHKEEGTLCACCRMVRLTVYSDKVRKEKEQQAEEKPKDDGAAAAAAAPEKNTQQQHSFALAVHHIFTCSALCSTAPPPKSFLALLFPARDAAAGFDGTETTESIARWLKAVKEARATISEQQSASNNQRATISEQQ